MSNVKRKDKSFKKINLADLKKLVEIAKRDQHDFFNKYPHWEKAFANRFIFIALCQGAAQHYVDNKNGINDFDVYTFYKKNPNKRWCAKRKKIYDFNDSKFGQSSDKPNYIGRRVDCFAREIEIKKNENIIIALRRYLKNSNTDTSKCLSKKSVVLLEPKCGFIVWKKEII